MKLITQEKLYKDSRVRIICDDKKYIDIAYKEIIRQRTKLEKYISKYNSFETSLRPLRIPGTAPKIVKLMADGARIAKTGPMAAVAGTIAEMACRKMKIAGAKVAIVENGGDIFAISEVPINIGLFSGIKEIETLALKLKPAQTPVAICSSSSHMGHSMSLGECDLATVFSKKSYVADAVATAVANRVKKESDIKETLDWAFELKEVDGILIMKNKKIGMIGNIPQIIPHKDKRIKEKITKDPIYDL